MAVVNPWKPTSGLQSLAGTLVPAVLTGHATAATIPSESLKKPASSLVHWSQVLSSPVVQVWAVSTSYPTWLLQDWTVTGWTVPSPLLEPVLSPSARGVVSGEWRVGKAQPVL